MSCDSKQDCIDHGVLVPEECRVCPRNDKNNSEFFSRAAYITDSKVEQYVISTQFAMRVAVGLATQSEVKFFNKYLSLSNPETLEKADDFKSFVVDEYKGVF